MLRAEFREKKIDQIIIVFFLLEFCLLFNLQLMFWKATKRTRCRNVLLCTELNGAIRDASITSLHGKLAFIGIKFIVL